MARILVTGSADGLGLLAAKALIDQGHQVVLHARSEKRARETLQKIHNAEGCVIGDLSDVEQTKLLAEQINGLGNFNAVIHNAAVHNSSYKEVLAVNVLSPYILTCLMRQPERLIYLSSRLHMQGQLNLKNLKSGISYSDSKLLIWMLCQAVARRWPNVYVNSVNPGWVPTKMGGSNATDDLQKGYETQVWLAASDDKKAKVSGRYFFHKKESPSNPEADDVHLQDELLNQCAALTGISFPK